MVEASAILVRVRKRPGTQVRRSSSLLGWLSCVPFQANADRRHDTHSCKLKSSFSTSILLVLLKYFRQVDFPLAMFPSTQI